MTMMVDSAGSPRFNTSVRARYLSERTQQSVETLGWEGELTIGFCV